MNNDLLRTGDTTCTEEVVNTLAAAATDEDVLPTYADGREDDDATSDSAAALSDDDDDDDDDAAAGRSEQSAADEGGSGGAHKAGAANGEGIGIEEDLSAESVGMAGGSAESSATDEGFCCLAPQHSLYVARCSNGLKLMSAPQGLPCHTTCHVWLTAPVASAAHLGVGATTTTTTRQSRVSVNPCCLATRGVSSQRKQGKQTSLLAVGCSMATSLVNSRIFVLEYPGFKYRSCLVVESSLELCALDLSKDGRFLVALSRIPERVRLSLFSTVDGSLVGETRQEGGACPEGAPAPSESASSVLFCPDDNNYMAVLQDGRVSLYSAQLSNTPVSELLASSALLSTADIGASMVSMNQTIQPPKSSLPVKISRLGPPQVPPKSSFTCLAWGRGAQTTLLFAGDAAGRVYGLSLDPEEHALSQSSLVASAKPASPIVTKLVPMKDGRLVFVSADGGVFRLDSPNAEPELLCRCLPDNSGRSVSQVAINYREGLLLVKCDDSSLVRVPFTSPPPVPCQPTTPAFHASVVNGISVLPDYQTFPSVLSCGDDGKIFAWGYGGNTVEQCFGIGAAFSAMASSPSTNLVAVGSRSGVLRILATSNPIIEGAGPIPKLRLIHEVKLFNSEISQISWHPNQLCLAIVAKPSQLCLLDTVSPSFKKICFVDVAGPAEITDVTWNHTNVDKQLLFLTTTASTIVRVTVPSQEELKGAPDGRTLTLRDVRANVMKVNSVPHAIVMDAKATNVNKHSFYVLTEDRSLKRYVMTASQCSSAEESSAQGPAAQEVAVPKEEIVNVHVKPIKVPGTCKLVVSPDGGCLVSFNAADGLLQVRRLSSESGQLHAAVKTVAKTIYLESAGKRCSLACSADSRFVFVTANHGRSVLRFGLGSSAESVPITPASYVPYRTFSSLEEVKGRDDAEVETDVAAPVGGAATSRLATFGQEQEGSMRQRLSKVRQAVKDIRQANNALKGSEEQLSFEEVLINTEERERLRVDSLAKIGEHKAKMKDETLAKDLIASRLKSEFFDSMQYPALVIRPFPVALSSGVQQPPAVPEVPNYPLRKASPEESLRRQQIALLRRAELLPSQNEGAHRRPPAGYFSGSLLIAAHAKAAPEPPQGASLAVSVGSAWDKQAGTRPNTSASPNSLGASTATGVVTGQQPQNNDTESLKKLLYHPFDLHCPGRKRTQAWLLRFLVRETQKGFDEDVLRLLDVKKDTVAKIAEKHKRVEDILAELSSFDTAAATAAAAALPPPTSNELEDCEVVDSVLRVSEEEIRKYLASIGAHNAAGAGPSSGGSEKSGKQGSECEGTQGADEEQCALRGLRTMMGGKFMPPSSGGAPGSSGFEQRLLAEASGHVGGAPEWYSKREPETEEERKQKAEYEKKVAAAKEELNKHVKALQTELKKAHQAMEDMRQGFNDKLLALASARHSTDMTIAELKLVIVKLQLALMAQEKCVTKEGDMIAKLESLKKQRNRGASQLGELRAQYDAAKAEYDMRVRDDKRTLSNFMVDFKSVEKDDLFPVLQRIFFHRHHMNAPPGSSEASKHQQAAAVTEDPFAGVEPREVVLVDLERAREEEIDEERSLQTAPEKPEEIDEVTMERVLEMRTKKIRSEIQLRKAAAALEAAKIALLETQKRSDRVKQEIASITSQLSEHHVGEVIPNTWDQGMMFRLKQGQVELDQSSSPVVTRMDDAVLIRSEQVEKLNDEIRALSQRKVSVLEEMARARKVIEKRQWENDGLDMQAEDLQTKTKQLQLMRVTKQLQQFLSTTNPGCGGTLKPDEDPSEQQHKEEVAAIQKRAEYDQEMYQKKMAELQKRLAKIGAESKVKERDNERLQQELTAVVADVTERSKIREVQGQQGPAGRCVTGSPSRLDKFYHREQLETTIKEQADEILHLRNQLQALACQPTLTLRL